MRLTRNKLISRIALFLGCVGTASAFSTNIDPSCGPGYSTLVGRETGKLNTERLADKFGPITTHLHSQKGGRREVFFRDANQIPRGFATSQIHYDRNVPEELSMAHTLITTGGSMGKTFKELGFTIRKENLHESVEALPEHLREPFNAAMGTRRSYTFVAVSPTGHAYRYADVEEWTPN